MKASISLVLGGVSSGKSVFAEQLADSKGATKLYIATAQVFDEEMAAKVSLHQDRRGPDWNTLEAPFDIAGALSKPTADVVLVDCLSMWLTNCIFDDADIGKLTDGLTEAVLDCPKPIVLVSNEVGLGGVEANDLARRFALEQGKLNQRIATISDEVVLVSAGLPLYLKGSQ